MHHPHVGRPDPYALAPRPLRRSTRHLVFSALGWGLTGVAVFGAYVNVFSDDTALREETAQLARHHAACGERCRLTETEIHRSLIEYRADFDIEGVGKTRVICRRAAIAFGAEECAVR